MASFRWIRSAATVAVVTGVAFVMTAGFAAAQAMVQAPAELVSYPDVIMTNGKVLTVDKDFSVQQGLAIRDGKILMTGTNAAISRLAGPRTQKIDLGGKSVIPGIIDTHLHGQGAGVQANIKLISDIEPKVRDYNNILKVTGGSIAELLENLKTGVASRTPGTWVQVTLPSELLRPFWEKVRVQDLDKAAPNNPLVVHAMSIYYMLNTKVYDAMKAYYGALPPEAERDASGNLTGRCDTSLMESVIGDILYEHPRQSMYPALKSYLEGLAAFGITTDSGRIIPLWYQPIYRELEAKHELAIRINYSALGTQINPNSPDFYKRLGNINDMGTDMIWMSGAGVVLTDGAFPYTCTTLAPENTCEAKKPTDVRRMALFEAVKYGNRIVNTHDSGDGAVDNVMDIIEEASKAAGMTPAEVQAKVHTMDHCSMNPRPDQIERGKKLGIMWACAASAIDGAAGIAAQYGTEYANRWVVPVGSILKAGGKVSGHGEGMKGDSYFTNLEMLLTRKDSQGRVWGKADAIERQDLLRMYTIWAAEYSGRRDRLGSLEPGKLADLVVIDRDYMTIPIEEFHTIHAMTTMVGGKVVYQRPDKQASTTEQR